MSKRSCSVLVAFCIGSLLSSCNFACAENYFDEATYWRVPIALFDLLQVQVPLQFPDNLREMVSSQEPADRG